MIPRWGALCFAILLTAALAPRGYAQRSGGSGRGGGRSRGASKRDQPPEVHPTFVGELASISGKEIFVAVENGNQLRFRITGKTVIQDGAKKDGDPKLKLSALAAKEPVAVEARVAPDGTYDAVTVTVNPPPPPPPAAP
jgi:hypothetical protein